MDYGNVSLVMVWVGDGEADASLLPLIIIIWSGSRGYLSLHQLYDTPLVAWLPRGNYHNAWLLSIQMTITSVRRHFEFHS